MRFLVLGEECQDVFQYGSATRLDPAAPAPILVPSRKTSNSGMAGNVVTNLESLGVDVTFFSQHNPITKTRYVDDKTNHLLMRLDVGDKETKPFPIDFIKSISFEDFDCVIVSDYCKGLLTYEAIAEICARHDNVFIDTKKIINDHFSKAKFIKINSVEFEASKESINSLEGLIDKIIYTTGKQGCTFQGQVFPVDEVEVKDQSGAGDTFMAALAFKFTETNDISKSIVYANECATKVVSKRGVVSI